VWTGPASPISASAPTREVLDLVVTGMLNKQIAERLGVAEKTIKVHRGRVMQKMTAASVADLVRMLHKLGRETSRTLTVARPWDQRPIAEDRRVPAE
jgi:DNA-binding NarL/FixJ family response regulator